MIALYEDKDSSEVTAQFTTLHEALRTRPRTGKGLIIDNGALFAFAAVDEIAWTLTDEGVERLASEFEAAKKAGKVERGPVLNWDGGEISLRDFLKERSRVGRETMDEVAVMEVGETITFRRPGAFGLSQITRVR